MLTIISHSLFFFLIIYANGFFFCKKFLKVEKKVDIYEVSLIGLISTIFIAQFINFFSPLSDVWILLNFLFSLIVIYYYRDFIFKKKKVKLKYLSIFFVLIIAQIYGSNFSDDIDHYHYSYILNSDKFNYIIGNSYLHHLYGTSPIWLVAHSFFNFDYTRLQDIHILNGIILFLLISFLFNEFESKKKSNNIYVIIVFSFFLFILFKYTRLKEFGIDRPSILFFCFFVIFYLKNFVQENKKNLISNFIVLSLICILILSIKIIYLPMIIIPIYVFFKNRYELLRFDLRYLIILFSITIFILQNILSSGCFIYPLELTCLEILPWSNEIGAENFSSFHQLLNRSWNTYNGKLSQAEYIQNFNWISNWFNRSWKEILEFFLLSNFIVFLVFLSFFKFNFKKINFKHKNISFLLITGLIIFLSLLIFFFQNPIVRMNHHIFILYTVLLIIFCFNFFEYKFNKNFVIFILILSLTFNFLKNLNRINEVDFVNNPKKILSSKINNQKKIIINDFNFYKGWYGLAPVTNNDLLNRKYKKVFIFHIIY